MKTSESVLALKMALENMKGPFMSLIHHSDRGLQYCSQEYTSILKSKNIKISMTESGDPLDNALAERMNGILKTEYLEKKEVRNASEGWKIVEKAVEAYNKSRPHMSCGMHTPDDIYEGRAKPKVMWKNYYRSTIKKNVKLLQDKEKFVN